MRRFMTKSTTECRRAAPEPMHWTRKRYFLKKIPVGAFLRHTHLNFHDFLMAAGYAESLQ
jgi:hypothetical protein